MKETLDFFAKKLIDWYLHNKRDLPWRTTRDPYFIWLSEIILQQTRVAQGTPYYFAFIAAFPDVKSLANAPQEQVLKLWQGLGYYSRARNLHIAAQYVANDLDGIFPFLSHLLASRIRGCLHPRVSDSTCGLLRLTRYL